MFVTARLALRPAAFGLLGFASLLVIAESELETGDLRTAVRNLDLQVSVVVFLVFLPTLATRLKRAGDEIGLPIGDRMLACHAEAALYGFMLIQPLASWLVAILDQESVYVLGVKLPLVGSGDPVLAAHVSGIRELGAGLVLLILALHIRSRGLAMVVAAMRSLARESGHIRNGRKFHRPSYKRRRVQTGEMHPSDSGSKVPQG